MTVVKRFPGLNDIWPQAIYSTTANVSERDGAAALLVLNSNQFCLVKRVMADGGYTRENFADLVQSTIGAEMIIAKQSDLKHGWITPQKTLWGLSIL